MRMISVQVNEIFKYLHANDEVGVARISWFPGCEIYILTRLSHSALVRVS